MAYVHPLLVTLGLLLASGTASARSSTDATALAPVTVVYLAPLNREQEARELAQAVRSQLSDVRARLRLAWSAPRRDTLEAWLAAARATARVEHAAAVFFTTHQRLHLAFVDKQGLRLLIRSLGTTRATERAEAVALILRSALAAYLRGARLPEARPVPRPRPRPRPRDRPRPPPPPGKALPAPRRGPTDRLTLELGYVFDSFSNQAVANHGLGVSLALRVARDWRIRLGGRWSPEMTLRPDAAEDPMRARLQRIPIFLAGRYQRRLGRFTLGVELGVVLEYLRMRIEPTELVERGGDDGDWRAALEPALYGAVRVAPRLRIHVRLSAEIGLRLQEFGYLQPSDYGFNPAVTGPFISFGREWAVKPRAEVGLTVDLF